VSATFPGTEDEWNAAREAWQRKAKLQVTVVGEQLVVSAPVAKRRLSQELIEATSEDDDSSFRSVEVTLARHSTDVQEMAASFARSVGFGPPIAADLALAASLHDVGKADPRFQRWLVGGNEVRASMQAAPLAKSRLPAGNRWERKRAQSEAKYPAGYRHELLSVEMIRAHALLERAHDRELVLHLVGSHHGWCRPFAPPIDHPEDLSVALTHEDDELRGSTRHRLARLDSGVSDRFWNLIDRYGWWGLAWLEAVVRLADHRASEHESAGDA
jgi:CRISPR-associated endonuclease/helicase Cas3